MNQYLLLIHGNQKTAATAPEWDRFFTAARESGMFKGGSEVGEKEMIGDTSSAGASAHIVGYMRFDCEDNKPLIDLLKQHPVVLHGGSVELCELPKS